MAWRGSRPGEKGPVLAGSGSRLAPSGRSAEEVAVVINLRALCLSAPLTSTTLGSRWITGGALYCAVNGNGALNGDGCWLGAILLAPPCRSLVRRGSPAGIVVEG